MPSVCCLCVLLFMLLAASCGSGGGVGRVPKDTVDAFFTAIKNGDFDSAYGMLSASDRQQVTMEQWREANTGTEAFDFKISGAEKVEGKDAAVGVVLTQGGNSKSVNMALVKENGIWNVSLEKSSSLNSN